MACMAFQKLSKKFMPSLLVAVMLKIAAQPVLAGLISFGQA